MRRFLVLAALLATFVPALADAQFDHTHATLTALLRKHVVLIDSGKASQVRYAGLQQDRTILTAYRDSLAKVAPEQFRGWSKDQQLAFLINAYNASTIELILTRFPNIRSVWDFGKVFNNPFKQKFIRLLGREMSLDDIEHGTIRADGSYNDPRIHFAVNCASVGCPMLREEAYVAERLDKQLEEQTARFLTDRTRNRYSVERRSLEVSKIFDWYGDDFRKGWKGHSTLEAFFSKYASLLADRPEDQNAIREGQATIRHLDYDWALNSAR
jgi:hypothetical protein